MSLKLSSPILIPAFSPFLIITPSLSLQQSERITAYLQAQRPDASEPQPPSDPAAVHDHSTALVFHGIDFAGANLDAPVSVPVNAPTLPSSSPTSGSAAGTGLELAFTGNAEFDDDDDEDFVKKAWSVAGKGSLSLSNTSTSGPGLSQSNNSTSSLTFHLDTNMLSPEQLIDYHAMRLVEAEEYKGQALDRFLLQSRFDDSVGSLSMSLRLAVDTVQLMSSSSSSALNTPGYVGEIFSPRPSKAPSPSSVSPFGPYGWEESQVLMMVKDIENERHIHVVAKSQSVRLDEAEEAEAGSGPEYDRVRTSFDNKFNELDDSDSIFRMAGWLPAITSTSMSAFPTFSMTSHLVHMPFTLPGLPTLSSPSFDVFNQNQTQVETENRIQAQIDSFISSSSFSFHMDERMLSPDSNWNLGQLSAFCLESEVEKNSPSSGSEATVQSTSSSSPPPLSSPWPWALVSASASDEQGHSSSSPEGDKLPLSPLSASGSDSEHLPDVVEAQENSGANIAFDFGMMNHVVLEVKALGQGFERISAKENVNDGEYDAEDEGEGTYDWVEEVNDDQGWYGQPQHHAELYDAPLLGNLFSDGHDAQGDQASRWTTSLSTQFVGTQYRCTCRSSMILFLICEFPSTLLVLGFRRCGFCLRLCPSRRRSPYRGVTFHIMAATSSIDAKAPSPRGPVDNPPVLKHDHGPFIICLLTRLFACPVG
ncbi:hypothetical protein D9758_010900 [Tetrapyrgos nigripes]|uniref:Uncharacterized protein n=1 Tax=Tetrapyrgos nigripes TaxID=182062 RepID=A0A8H5CUU9_9AGAR|nr:hypothetical protein D9758_010900 [Tetrapyrgos nigripes]